MTWTAVIVVAVSLVLASSSAAQPRVGRGAPLPPRAEAIIGPDGKGMGFGPGLPDGAVPILAAKDGEAPPGVPVRIYVDNRPAAMVVGDAKGAWAAGLDEALPPGTYTLRVDQLDAGGQTVARIETPFTRVSEPPVEGNLQVDYVVVQPGNSLWRIARRERIQAWAPTLALYVAGLGLMGALILGNSFGLWLKFFQWFLD